MQLISPTICPRRFRPTFEIIFHFYDDKGFGTSRETASCGMIDIADTVYAQRQCTGQRSSEIWNVDAIIWSSRLLCMYWDGHVGALTITGVICGVDIDVQVFVTFEGARQ